MGATLYQKDKKTNKQRKKSAFLKRNEEVFDTKLCTIINTLEIFIKETPNTSNMPITIFSDLQKAFQEIQYSTSYKN